MSDLEGPTDEELRAIEDEEDADDDLFIDLRREERRMPD